MSVLCVLLGATVAELAAVPPNDGKTDVTASYDSMQPRLNLDKNWHALHFILCNTTKAGKPPLNFLLAGGKELIGPAEFGFDGGDRAFDPAQVRTLAAALRDVAFASLEKHFTAKTIDKHALYGFDASQRDVGWQELAAEFARMQQFVDTLAQAGQALIVHMD